MNKKLIRVFFYIIFLSFILIGGMFLLCIFFITSPNRSNKFSFDEDNSLIIADKGNIIKDMTIKMENDSNCFIYTISLKEDSTPSSYIRLDSLVPNTYTLIVYDLHKIDHKESADKIPIAANSEYTIHNSSYGDCGGYNICVKTNENNKFYQLK